MSIPNLRRCQWPARTPLETLYHDSEWGVPIHEDRGLFEFLVLEGAQAGLSWSTVLARRASYRRAFAGFDPAAVARFTPRRMETLLQDPGIIRNRLKVHSAVSNARCFLRVQEQWGSFDRFAWNFVDGTPIQNHWRRQADVPAHSDVSDRFSRELRRLGFGFVGTTITYAFMQAVGMVNDHLVDCFRYRQLATPGSRRFRSRRPQ